ncbi:uncharacterized protein DUF2505 [Nocardia tenerifensis]|uniref:Uncharacterized protein DUF2505 n=1 Tax=Nocardia tenerifensis TaxID=228006 RepID=A0A318JQ94_9NOCA|nr:DUF2505 domain-containing protein [Nocardia tenerifensis]PXX55557.1 uncharacterized protein DUF2505 [Nocardia tenerifensis]
MSRNIIRTSQHPYPAADIYRALTAREYWRDRVAALDGAGADLTSFEFDGTATKVSISKPAPAGRLPGKLADLIPSSVRLEVNESWGPFVEDTAHGTMRADVVGTPISLSAALVLRGADAASSTMAFEGQVEVRIPMLGRAVESGIAGDVGKEMAAIAEFTSSWVASNRQRER